MSEETAKKLAMEVRQSKESEQFDLAGYGPNSVAKMVQDAFTTPLPLDSMVRLSFVVGGGKKVRQKYNDGLVRELTSALSGIGFTEDKGAALALECAGQYKYQHDTSKDLMFVHVFPRVDPAAAAALAPGDGPGVPDAMSPTQLLLFSEPAVFERMVAAKTPSFAQRRRVLDVLKKAKADYAAVEAKLGAMEAPAHPNPHPDPNPHPHPDPDPDPDPNPDPDPDHGPNPEPDHGGARSNPSPSPLALWPLTLPLPLSTQAHPSP